MSRLAPPSETRREYLYRRSLEGREKEVYEKRSQGARQRWPRASPSRRNCEVRRPNCEDWMNWILVEIGRGNRAPGALDDEYARSLTG